MDTSWPFVSPWAAEVTAAAVPPPVDDQLRELMVAAAGAAMATRSPAVALKVPGSVAMP